MNLIIDEGNTRIKLAVFNSGYLLDLVCTNLNECLVEINNLFFKYNIESVIVSSVTDEIKLILDSFFIKNIVYLSNKTKVPFKNEYETPETLGVDRIALVAAAWHNYPNQSSLIIDAGTCITYDYITSDGVYLGGAISLGLEMRFKSMHVFTKKLPSLSVPDSFVKILGKTTKQSMESGVLHGLVFELDGYIANYKQEFNDVNVILTGGDANFLCKQLKNSIFVNPNFLLEGLNAVLTYQNER